MCNLLCKISPSWNNLNPKYAGKSKFFSFFYHLNLKNTKSLKTIFLVFKSSYSRAFMPLWGNLKSSYARKRDFDVWSAEGRRGWILPKLRLSGGQGFKTNLYTKIRESVFHKIARAVLSKLVEKFFYICTSLSQSSYIRVVKEYKHIYWMNFWYIFKM